MRVTNTIKEYIKKQVRAKYEARRKAITRGYYSEQEIINAKLKELSSAANAEAMAFLAENYPDWAKTCGDRGLISYGGVSNSPKWNKVYAEENKLTHEIDEHIEEIIIALELGGSRAELEEMLAKI